jgi:hypothetical protein
MENEINPDVAVLENSTETTTVIVPDAQLTSAQELLKAFQAGEEHIKDMIESASNDSSDEKEHLVERDVTDLMEKFNTNKSKNKPKNKPLVKQQSVLLVPSHRQASTYLEKAFNTTNQKNSAVGGEDGVDHINISFTAATALGEFLDINANTPFEHRELAHFTSIGGLWYYVKCEKPDERFRYTWGERNRVLGKRLALRDVVGFKTIIADATWMKIVSNEAVVRDLVESTLPFKNYYYYGPLNLRKTTPEAIWYTAAIDEIRRTLKMRANTGSVELMPDFYFLENNNL